MKNRTEKCVLSTVLCSMNISSNHLLGCRSDTSMFSSALPRQRIELQFNEKFFIEASFECRFDHIEVRDGPFSFSPLINRFCGSVSPGLVLSSGRFMWIRFFSDDELEGIGFRVQYSFTAGQHVEKRMVWSEGNVLPVLAGSSVSWLTLAIFFFECYTMFENEFTV